MSVLGSLEERSGSACEFCGATNSLKVYTVPPALNEGVDNSVLACATCLEQIEDPEKMDPNHWRCLNDSMWNEHEPVKIMVWRMLSRLRKEGWPQDLLDMLYLEDDTLAKARAMGDGDDEEKPKHRDSNGAELQNGDSVVLIKDLDVKGSSITAKRGTAVRRISLVHDNPEQIEGKVEGQHIVILTKFVKKST